jgi:hypothetical protein
MVVTPTIFGAAIFECLFCFIYEVYDLKGGSDKIYLSAIDLEIETVEIFVN